MSNLHWGSQVHGTLIWHCGSSVSVVSDYGLDDREIEVRSPTGAEDFSSSPCIQTGSGAHPASCPMGTGGPFPGGKARPGRDANHSPPSSAEVKYEQELYLLSPHAPPWHVAGHLYPFYLMKCSNFNGISSMWWIFHVFILWCVGISLFNMGLWSCLRKKCGIFR
jgi:hypothetical protein